MMFRLLYNNFDITSLTWLETNPLKYQLILRSRLLTLYKVAQAKPEKTGIATDMQNQTSLYFPFYPFVLSSLGMMLSKLIHFPVCLFAVDPII